MILFLDFDGVLHPYGGPSPHDFCELPRINKLLREPDYQHVEVVIMSAWRTMYEINASVVTVTPRPLVDMQQYFPANLQHRIIGTTPYLGGLENDGIREREVRHWLHEQGQTSRPWIALDDFEHLFEPDCKNLVVVPSYTGLDDETEAVLRLRLRLAPLIK